MKSSSRSEKEKILNFFRKDSFRTWYSVMISNYDNSVTVYTGRGLNCERDGIDPEDINEDNTYLEMEDEEIKALMKTRPDLNFRFVNSK